MSETVTPQQKTDATIVEIKDESKTIRRLRLQVQDKTFSFKAGQWIDFYIPDVTPFTGYSMCSSPDLLTEKGVLDIAVQHSDYPPTLWVHEKCKVGDVVQVGASGDFFYDPSPSMDKGDMLLIAGGIGINPIFSILQHFAHLNNTVSKTGSATLLYSAQNLDELVFKDEIIKLSKENWNISAKLFTTREKVDSSKVDSAHCFYDNRISDIDIGLALSPMNRSTTEAYICGPPAFIDTMEALCLKSGLRQDQIHFEKWWKKEHATT